MSVFLEFPSIEDYPVYSNSADNQAAEGLIPANAFSWLMTLKFSSLQLTDPVSFEAAPAKDIFQGVSDVALVKQTLTGY